MDQFNVAETLRSVSIVEALPGGASRPEDAALRQHVTERSARHVEALLSGFDQNSACGPYSY